MTKSTEVAPLSEQELATLKNAKGLDGWKAAVSAVTSKRNGEFPPDWQTKVLDTDWYEKKRRTGG